MSNTNFQIIMSTDSVIELNVNQNDIVVDDNEDAVSVHMEEEETEEHPQPEVDQSEQKKEVKHIFYSDIYIPEFYLRTTPNHFEYRFMTGSLEKMVEIITSDIRDTSVPKLLIIQCFGKVLYNRTNASVIDAVYNLIKLVDDQGIHKIAPSTNHFIPAKPRTWEHCAHFNAEMRICCIDRGQPPLTLHKALMDREAIDHGPLFIKGPMWTEYLSGQGLGHTLSKAGYRKIIHFVLKAFEHQFQARHTPSKRYIGTPQPPPLSETPGYSDNDNMLRILEEEGLLSFRHRYRAQQVAPDNRFQAIDPQEHHSVPQPVVPQPRQSSSTSSLNQAVPQSSESERRKTWYGQNMVITEGGAARKISMPGPSGANNDSGVFDESPRASKTRSFNEDQQIREAYENLKINHNRDEEYYKNKIDALIMDKEDLKDRVADLKEENETLRAADELSKTKQRSLQRQLDSKAEECILKDERIKMVEEQCRFIKNLHEDMGDLFTEKNEKQDKKKKRNN